MLIIITTMSVAYARMACDEDAARALKRPWAPVVFHGERETESVPEIMIVTVILRVITVMVITGNYSTGKILPESIFGYRVMTFGVEG